MMNIKTFLIAIVVGHLLIFFELWVLPYETVYLLYTLNSVIVVVTGILMIKYIIKLNKKLNSEEEISKTLLDLSLDGIYIENDRGQILDCNKSGHEMFGYTKKEMLNLSIKDLVPEEFAHELPEIIPDDMATGEMYLERINKKKNGSLFPTEINSKYIYMNSEKRLIVFIRDITVKKQIENNLIEMSLRDELTKVYNRRYIMKKIQDEIFSSNINNFCFSLALLDIDDFKKVNDNFGHLFGDEVLIKFSNTIVKDLRETDSLGRIGGEEFIIIFPNTPLKKSHNILSRIKEKLNSILWGKNDFSLTFSAGLFEFNDQNIHKYTHKDIIKLIDDLMYKAKILGKNRIITPDTLNNLGQNSKKSKIKQ